LSYFFFFFSFFFFSHIFFFQKNRNAPPVASEAGTRTFAARDALQWELRCFLAERHGNPVIVEHTASAQGIVNCHAFLSTPKGARAADEAAAQYFADDGDLRLQMPESTGAAALGEDADTAQASAAVTDAAGVVARWRSDPVCHRAVTLYLHLLAHELQETAMMAVPLGGLVLAGGVVSRLREAGLGAAVAAAARRATAHHPILGAMLGQVPVLACVAEGAGLDGATQIALRGAAKS
jgi:glucokinase